MTAHVGIEDRDMLRDCGPNFAEQRDSIPRPTTAGTIQFITYQMVNLPGRELDDREFMGSTEKELSRNLKLERKD